MPHPRKLIPTECYDMRLSGFSQREIAEKFSVSEAAVSKAIDKVTSTDAFKFGILSVETFLQWFRIAEEFFASQTRQYHTLIQEVQEMKPNTDKEKRAKIDLIRKLMESQGRTMENIVMNAKQGEVILAIQLVREVLKKNAPAKPLIISKIEATEEPDEPAATKKGTR